MSFRLKDRLQEKILEWRPRTEKLLKEYGHVVIDQVTIGQVIGGMRGGVSIAKSFSWNSLQRLR